MKRRSLPLLGEDAGRIAIKHSKLLYTVALALAPQFCFAQQLALNAAVDAMTDTAATSNPESIVASTAAITPPTKKPLTSRWLDLQTLSHSERYRNTFEVGGFHGFESAQQRSLIEGKIKLDAEGRYDIGFRASSGRYYNWAYGSYTGASFLARVGTTAANAAFYTPAEYLEALRSIFADPAGLKEFVGLRGVGGIQSNGWEFYMRELYFSAMPVKPVTVEFGSFGIERGYSTEITTFDDDGYLSGERIRLHNSKHLFFDEVAFTNAYFGDLATVNLFDRGSSLKKSNYRQVTAKKQLNTRVSFSGEYTWQTGIDTLREAFVVKTPEIKVVDGVRFEAYERLNDTMFAGLSKSPIGPIPALTVKGASGFAVAVDKKLGNLSGDFGFATIDNGYSVYANSRTFHAASFTLNGDAYGLGNRPFVHASYKIAPGITAFGFYTHEIGSTRVQTYNQQGLNAGVTLDLKEMVNKEKLVF